VKSVSFSILREKGSKNSDNQDIKVDLKKNGNKYTATVNLKRPFKSSRYFTFIPKYRRGDMQEYKILITPVK